jgi:hypothetical protein
MEVAEWRDDIIWRNCSWAVWSSGGLSLGCDDARNVHGSDGDEF